MLELNFMVDPQELSTKAFIQDSVRVCILIPDSEHLYFLGESGRKMAHSGFKFIMASDVAENLKSLGVVEIYT